MEDLLGLNTWGIDIIRWIQSWSNGFLDGLFLAITQLGYETAYLVALPLIYWCINRRWGLRLFYLVMLSTGLNEILKNLLGLPRPDAALVRRLDEIEGFGLPSNHAQTGSIVVWGFLASRVRRSWFTILAIVIALLISLSRLYLGAHFPQDVIAGWLLGGLVLWLALRFENFVEQRWQDLSLGAQVAVLIGVPLLLLFLAPADHLGIYPTRSASLVSGILIGAGLGTLWERRAVRFRVAGPLWQRVLRYVLGVAVVFVVYAASSSIPDLTPRVLDLVVQVSRLILLGLIAFALSPWLFVRLGLAESELKLEES